MLNGLVYVRGTRRETVNGDTSDEDAPDPDENASLNGSSTRQTAGGVAAALSKTIGAHQVQFGASVDASRVRFRQQEQEGSFDATRGVIAGDEERRAVGRGRGALHRARPLRHRHLARCCRRRT